MLPSKYRTQGMAPIRLFIMINWSLIKQIDLYHTSHSVAFGIFIIIRECLKKSPRRAHEYLLFIRWLCKWMIYLSMQIRIIRDGNGMLCSYITTKPPPQNPTTIKHINKFVYDIPHSSFGEWLKQKFKLWKGGGHTNTSNVRSWWYSILERDGKSSHICTNITFLWTRSHITALCHFLTAEKDKLTAHVKGYS